MITLAILNIIVWFAIFLLIMAGIDVRTDHTGINLFDIIAIILIILIVVSDCAILLI